jgi:hypothetical protein
LTENTRFLAKEQVNHIVSAQLCSLNSMHIQSKLQKGHHSQGSRIYAQFKDGPPEAEPTPQDCTRTVNRYDSRMTQTLKYKELQQDIKQITMSMLEYEAADVEYVLTAAIGSLQMRDQTDDDPYAHTTFGNLLKELARWVRWDCDTPLLLEPPQLSSDPALYDFFQSPEYNKLQHHVTRLNMLREIRKETTNKFLKWENEYKLDLRHAPILWNIVEPHLLHAFETLDCKKGGRFTAYIRPTLTYDAWEAANSVIVRHWTEHISEQAYRGRKLDPVLYTNPDFRPLPPASLPQLRSVQERSRSYHVLDPTDRANALVRALNNRTGGSQPQARYTATVLGVNRPPNLPISSGSEFLTTLTPEERADMNLLPLESDTLWNAIDKAGLPLSFHLRKPQAAPVAPLGEYIVTVLKFFNHSASHDFVTKDREFSDPTLTLEQRAFRLWTAILGQSDDCLSYIDSSVVIEYLRPQNAWNSEKAWKLIQFLVYRFGNYLFMHPEFLDQYILGPLRHALGASKVPHIHHFIERSHALVPEPTRLDLRRWLVDLLGFPPTAVQALLLGVTSGCAVTNFERRQVHAIGQTAQVKLATPRAMITDSILTLFKKDRSYYNRPANPQSSWGLVINTTPTEKPALGKADYIPTPATYNQTQCFHLLRRAGLPPIMYYTPEAYALLAPTLRAAYDVQPADEAMETETDPSGVVEATDSTQDVGIEGTPDSTL